MDCDTLVIGAGPAGLAVAGCLAQAGRRAEIIEQAPQLAASWRTHYERLHLHTVKELSALPGLPFAPQLPRYVPRAGVVAYLEDYAATFGLVPHVGEAALAVTPAPGVGWRVATARDRLWRARQVVLATGANRRPQRPSFPGQADFAGTIGHSHGYRNAAHYAGRRVLVVGLGNTGAEIALDLAEHGVATALSVRSAVNIVRRDVLGRPTQRTALLLARLPPALGDRLGRWLRDWTVGDLSAHGLRTAAVSPLRQLRDEGRTPVIDVGTVDAIRQGRIRVHPGIARFLPDGVQFVDGTRAAFDHVLLATGYAPEVAQLFPDTPLPLDARGLPTPLHGDGALAGLHFVGFDIRQPGGLLRTIARQAQAVAQRIAATPPPA